MYCSTQVAICYAIIFAIPFHNVSIQIALLNNISLADASVGKFGLMGTW